MRLFRCKHHADGECTPNTATLYDVDCRALNAGPPNAIRHQANPKISLAAPGA